MMKVLIAIDDSLGSQQVVTFARDWLAQRDVSVTLLHVIVEHIMHGRTGAVPAEVYDMPRERANSQQLLDAAASSLREGGVGPALNTMVRTGVPEDVILDIAKDESTDLIIVGSRGLGATGRLLLGSVSTRVVTHAHTAVVVVHPHADAV